MVKNQTIRNLFISAGILFGIASVIGGVKKYKRYQFKQNKKVELQQQEENIPLEHPRKYITLK